jgi:hypothetical protein
LTRTAPARERQSAQATQAHEFSAVVTQPVLPPAQSIEGDLERQDLRAEAIESQRIDLMLK